MLLAALLPPAASALLLLPPAPARAAARHPARVAVPPLLLSPFDPLSHPNPLATAAASPPPAAPLRIGRRVAVLHGAAAAAAAAAASLTSGSAHAAGFADFVEQQQQLARADAVSPRAPPRVMAVPGEAVAAVAAPTDEFEVEFAADQPVGLTLRELRVGFEYGTREGTSRVLVADVPPDGQAARSGRIEIDNIVVAVDGVNVERESVKQVMERIARVRGEGRAYRVTFKDALAFNERLNDLTGTAADTQPIATVVAPATEAQPAQVFAVQRLELPARCRRNAQNGDLVEIRYAGRLADGQLFDGMELASRLADDSIQFVLGKQPAGQFPPAWDVGLVGMCVGERRQLDVPPALGFGAKGLPKRGVPPNARLIYDIELIAINADTSV